MKQAHVVNLVEKRIRQGDYALTHLPGERKLAEEAGVSYMTARKAVQRLIERGVLTRLPNGRIQINRRAPDDKVPTLQMAFLAPAFNAPSFQQYRVLVEQAARDCDAICRPVDFVHWDDPIVLETLNGFDGVFLASSTEPMPPHLLKRLQERTTPVIGLDFDASDWGIPSIQFFPPAAIWKLLDHLYELGHRRIDCLNTQAANPEITRRISEWRRWCAERGVEGELVDEPVAPYEHPTPQGYRVASRLLDAGWRGAWVCTTLGTAVGANRACFERKIRVGSEVSLCAINSAGLAPWQCPSLTSLELPDIRPLLLKCIDWIAKGGKPSQWRHPLCLQPDHVNLFIGESTGPRAGSTPRKSPAASREAGHTSRTSKERK